MSDNENHADKLEIVEGDGSGINMSPVSNYIIPMQPKMKSKKKKVVIPKSKSSKGKEDKKK